MKPALLPAIVPGTRIGLYEVERLISRGGFGAVYRVTRDGQPFALKLPLASGTKLSSQERRVLEQRIAREVVSLMSLQHPGVPRIHTFDRTDGGALYFAMDLVEGTPLLDWRRQEKPTLRELLSVFRDLALALDAVHQLGIVHRDIKSSNVLVARRDSRWQPVLVDFGLARPAFTPDVTGEFVLLGTEGHWAPEQVAGAAEEPRFKYPPASDLHCFGHLLYEALTGRAPFRGKTSGELLAAVLAQTPPAPSHLDASLPRALDELVLGLLAKRPEDRPPSALAVARALDAVFGGVSAPTASMPSLPPTIPARLKRPEETALMSRTRSTPPTVTVPPPHKEPTPAAPRRLAASELPLAPAAHPKWRPAARVASWATRFWPTLLAPAFIGVLLFVGVRADVDREKVAPREPLTPAAPSPQQQSPVSIERPAPGTVPPRPVRAATMAQVPGPVRAAPRPSPRSSPDAVVAVRAALEHPVADGQVEAAVRQPLLIGATLLPTGTVLAGEAQQLPDGRYLLQFRSIPRPDGRSVTIQGEAIVAETAARRLPLRAGKRPSAFEFDVSLTVPSDNAERASR